MDVADLIRRLLDRQRRLRHCQRLLGEALEEAVTWLNIPSEAMPLNAATYEATIWAAVAREAALGEVSSTSSPSYLSELAVLLQPGFPETVEAIQHALPDMGMDRVAGLRRRAWQRHMQGVLGCSHMVQLPAQNLYLVQTNASAPIHNWPSEVPRPTMPHHLRERYAFANRRRLRAIRRPTLLPRPLPDSPQGDVSPAADDTGSLVVSAAPGSVEAASVEQASDDSDVLLSESPVVPRQTDESGRATRPRSRSRTDDEL